MRREVAFVLAAAASAAGGPLRRRVAGEIGAEGLDWNFVVEHAARHGLASFVYTAVTALPAGAVPAAVIEKLRLCHFRNLRGTAAQSRVLLGLLARFGEEGLRAIPFKGVALGQQLYGTTGLRYSSDIDLLVPREETTRAESLLRRLGYEYIVPEVANNFEAAYRGAEGMVVELHWAFADGALAFPVDGPRFEGGSTVALPGGEVPGLAPEALLLVLAVNGYREYWRRLSGLLDVAALVKGTPSFPWRKAFRLARELDLERPLHLALLLTGRLYGVRFPARVASRAEGDGVARRVAGRLGVMLENEEGVFPAWTHLLLDPLMRRGWRHRARWFLVIPALMRPGGRDRGGIFAPLLRPVRLLASYGGDLLKVLGRSK
jgi:hypothetical protein